MRKLQVGIFPWGYQLLDQITSSMCDMELSATDRRSRIGSNRHWNSQCVKDHRPWPVAEPPRRHDALCSWGNSSVSIDCQDERGSENICNVSCEELSHIYVECTTDPFPSGTGQLGLYVFERDQIYTRLQSDSDQILMNQVTITSKTVKAIPKSPFTKHYII